jgi:hypothetical protein
MTSAQARRKDQVVKHKISKTRSAFLFACFSSLATICSSQQQHGVGVHNTLTDPVEKSILPMGLTIRSDFQWRYIEKKQGVLDIGDYSKLDALIDSAVNKGARPIIILCCAPTYYDAGDLPKSSAAMQAYLKYAKFMVAHFKGRVTQFEVWNEWNLNTGSKIKPKVWGDAPSYVALLREAYAAIKSENRDAIVIGGVVGGTDGRWIEKIISGGALAYMDAFSIHPYVHRHARNHPDDREFIWQASASALKSNAKRPVLGTPEEAITWIDQLRERINSASPNKDIPIYISEMGWPTSTSEFGVAENLAAAYLQRLLLMAATRPWIAGVWWYDLIDDGPDASNDEDRFGLFRQNGEPKPTYVAYMQVEQFLRSSVALKQSTGSEGEIQISGKYADNRKLFASWLPVDNLMQFAGSADVKAHIQSGYSVFSTQQATSVNGAPILLTQ